MGREASAFLGRGYKALFLQNCSVSLLSERPMGGQPKSKASSWSAEVGRLWEEPTEAISGKQTREAVGILAACGGEDVQLTSLLPRVSRQVIFRGSRAFLLGNSVDCVENTGTRHGTKVAVVNGRGGEASRGSL